MKIELDNRPSETKVIDSKLLEYAKPSEVVRLKSKVTNANYNTVANIIAASLNLKASESAVYNIMMLILKGKIGNQDTISIDELINVCSFYLDKDKITYRRAINGLASKGVIKYTKDNKAVTVVSVYNASKVDYNQVKTIVINLV